MFFCLNFFQKESQLPPMPDLTPANSQFPLVANEACPDKGAKWSVFLKGHNIRMAEMRSAMEIARDKARKKRLSQRSQLKNTGNDKQLLAN